MLGLSESNQWPPVFASHKNYDPNFPAWGGYPDHIRKASLKEILDSSDMPSGNSGVGQSPKSLATIEPRIHHTPVLLDVYRSRSTQPEPTELPSKVNKQIARPAKDFESVIYQTTQKPYSNQKRDTRSLPNSNFTNALSYSQIAPSSGGFKTRISMKEAETRTTTKPIVLNEASSGSFKTQIRVNAPVSLKEKMSSEAKQSETVKPPKVQPNPEVQIDEVLSEMENFKIEVKKFTGTSSADKMYRYLDEMLTRLMLKLDDVVTDGQITLRQKRRQAVKEIQQCIASLESQLINNQAKSAQNSSVQNIDNSAEAESTSF